MSVAGRMLDAFFARVRAAPTDFRGISGSHLNSFALNVGDLWLSVFGRRIDVVREIINPARQKERS